MANMAAIQICCLSRCVSHDASGCTSLLLSVWLGRAMLMEGVVVVVVKDMLKRVFVFFVHVKYWTITKCVITITL